MTTPRQKLLQKAARQIADENKAKNIIGTTREHALEVAKSIAHDEGGPMQDYYSTTNWRARNRFAAEIHKRANIIQIDEWKAENE